MEKKVSVTLNVLASTKRLLQQMAKAKHRGNASAAGDEAIRNEAERLTKGQWLRAGGALKTRK